MALDLMELPMPVTIRPAARLSDEDFLTFSALNHAYRIEQNKEGELIVMTPLGGVGANNEGIVSAELIMWTRSTGKGKSFSPNIGFRLQDGSCLCPDASWIPLDQWTALSRADRKKLLVLCPEFVIEVRSDSDRRKAVTEKMEQWMQNGVKLGWLIDPLEETVTVYRAGETVETLHRPDLVLGEGPVAGFILPTDELWQEQ